MGLHSTDFLHFAFLLLMLYGENRQFLKIYGREKLLAVGFLTVHYDREKLPRLLLVIETHR